MTEPDYIWHPSDGSLSVNEALDSKGHVVPRTTIEVTKTCMHCGDDNVTTVFKDEHDKWKAGALIQDAFPLLSADEREGLLTGYHGWCWDEMFADED